MSGDPVSGDSVSKERAIRRAERLAVAEKERARRERQVERRRQRRALARGLVPHVRFGRTGKLFARRSRMQRAAIATVVLVVLLALWMLTDYTLAAKIGISALVIIATPALTVLVLDRRI